MNRFLVTADLHAHQYSQFSVPDPIYGNSRLKTIVDCLYQIKTYALANKYDKLVIVGDVFHIRGVINATTFRIIYDVLYDLALSGIELYIVAGNHDQANKTGTITSLTGLRNIARVFEQTEVVDNCLMVPFQEHREQYLKSFELVKPGIQYIFAHAGIGGAQTNASEYKPKEELQQADVPNTKVDLVMLGHYHRTQVILSNMFYVGSLCHNSFEDNGEQKGFWAVSNEGVNFVPTAYPEFIVLYVKQKTDLTELQLNPNNYYWIKSSVDIKKADSWSNVIITKVDGEEETTAPRVKDIDKMSSDDTIASYVAYKNPAIDHRLLIKYGLEKIQAVKGVI